MARGELDATVVLAKVERAILGGGVLTLHASVYLLVTFGVFVRSLIADPTGLGFPNPWVIVPWGLLVLSHAGVVAAATVMRQPWAGGAPREMAGGAVRGEPARLARRGETETTRPAAR
ncbi:MAG: hypothetical protein H0U40_06100, partial [Chloroflexia bacterium]|nr:hypothetical protein [Chloroflexia bacterium]